MTAAIIHGVPPDEVTADMRRVAKTVNFGIIYGMQAHGLSRDTGLPRQEAQRFIDQYWANLPRVKQYFDGTLGFGLKHGYVESIYGRRRILGDLTSANYARRAAAERMAVNMPLQGSAADIMKIAMIRVGRGAGAIGVAGQADPAGPRRAGAGSRSTRCGGGRRAGAAGDGRSGRAFGAARDRGPRRSKLGRSDAVARGGGSRVSG